LLLALVAVLAANWLRVSTALSEIVAGTVAQLIIGALVGTSALGAKAPWITFLAGTGAIVLTFLAGAELAPQPWLTLFWAGICAPAG
jgi:glutathione-regulated potassium-efflux system ancillary protein KefC